MEQAVKLYRPHWSVVLTHLILISHCNNIHSSVFNMLNIIIAIPIIILLWLVLFLAYVKFENLTIFHCAQSLAICDYDITGLYC